MALNTSKCNHLTPLRFKGLNPRRFCSIHIRFVRQPLVEHEKNLEGPLHYSTETLQVTRDWQVNQVWSFQAVGLYKEIS